MADAQRGVPGEFRPTPDRAGGGPPTPPLGPQGSHWGYPPPAQRAKKWTAAGVVVAILIGLAALTVGIVALATRPAPSGVAAPSPNQPAAAPSDTTEADRALCSAVAPLMTENDEFSNKYGQLGDAGTPARDAATPKYVDDTLNWVSRIQPIIDTHPDIDPFLKRSLQRYVDDQHLIAIDLQPGPLTSYAKALFADSVGAYSGPLHLCHDLGITW